MLACAIAAMTASLAACGPIEPPKPEQWSLEQSDLADCDADNKLIHSDARRAACKHKDAAAEEEKVTERRSEIYRPAKPPREAERRLSVRLNGLSPPLFARLLSVATGDEIIAASGLKGEVRGRFDDATRRHVLGSLAALHGWSLKRHGRATLIRKANSGGAARRVQLSAQSDLLRLRHIEPKVFQDIVKSLFHEGEGRPIVVGDPQTRMVVVKGEKEAVERVHRLAEKIDVPARQVFIEAFIIEAGEDFERRLGSRLGYDLRRNNLHIAGVASAPGGDGLALGESEGSLLDLAAPGAIGGVGFLVDRRRLKFELTALEREGTTRIISNPRVFTLDNRQATVFQGDEVPYLSVSDGGTQTQFREAGVRLEVTPSVIGDGRLLIRVSVNKDSVDTRRDNPAITRRSIETNLIVADGAMAVIGGIYFNTQVKSTAGLPWLEDLPWVGGMFRSTSRQSDARELLVLLLPTVV